MDSTISRAIPIKEHGGKPQLVVLDSFVPLVNNLTADNADFELLFSIDTKIGKKHLLSSVFVQTFWIILASKLESDQRQ